MIRSISQPVVNLLIAGASTRSAAYSALRSGLSPLCLDLFADLDLHERVPVQKVPDLQESLLSALRQLPSLPLVYVGGLENQPEVLRAASEQHLLWGNDADVVAQIRNPATLQEAAGLARLSMPEWRSEENPPPRDGSWLIRPRFGSGGRDIQVWIEGDHPVPALNEPHIFQKRIEGTSYSGTFIADRSVGDVRFVGITQQLIGERICNAHPYQWCGNVGPVGLSIPVEAVVRRLANVLKWKLGIQGLFGIDFVLDAEGTPWVTEVNPRYPASAELLEHITGSPLLADHCRCFAPDVVPQTAWTSASQSPCIGKGILYSPRDFVLQQDLTPYADVSLTDLPSLADLPAIGTSIRTGDPICTVYALGSSPGETCMFLGERIQQLSAWLN
ncbi:ATP-grasp domain-containing protein [Planctomicrobium sp. SH664]|uniref:ATP-grasp domain-containing protein n=1 Tax=Planctomicrobium sp. SH664 TaxID=3448125 RepID=UPI003F5B0E34